MKDTERSKQLAKETRYCWTRTEIFKSSSRETQEAVPKIQGKVIGQGGGEPVSTVFFSR